MRVKSDQKGDNVDTFMSIFSADTLGLFLARSCTERTYVLKQFINQIVAAKCQVIAKSQLEKTNSEQLEQSFLSLQDEILKKQTELLKQNNMITWRFIKKVSRSPE